MAQIYDQSTINILEKPFALDEHGFRDGKTPDEGKCYLHRLAIKHRIEMVDPRFTLRVNPQVQVIGDTVTVFGALTILGATRENSSTATIDRWKWDTAENKKVEVHTDEFTRNTQRAIKSATSGLLQRCAQGFGIGMYLKEAPYKGVKTRADLKKLLDIELLKELDNPQGAASFVQWAREKSITNADLLNALGIRQLRDWWQGRTAAEEAVNNYIAEQLKRKEDETRATSSAQPAAKTAEQFAAGPTTRETTITRIEFKPTQNGNKPRWCATTSGNVPEARMFSLFGEQKCWIESSGYVITGGSTSIPVSIKYDGQYWNLAGVTPAFGHALVEPCSIIAVNAGESIFYEQEWFEVVAVDPDDNEMIVSVRSTPEESPFPLRISRKEKLLVRRRLPELAGA